MLPRPWQVELLQLERSASHDPETLNGTFVMSLVEVRRRAITSSRADIHFDFKLAGIHQNGVPGRIAEKLHFSRHIIETAVL